MAVADRALQTMTPPRRGSFHDPDGSVYFRGDQILRGLRPHAAERLHRFRSSRIAHELSEEGLIVSAEPCDGPDPNRIWFRHPRLPFVTYPHEWVPEQVADAALLTVRLARRLRAHGWDLKDGNLRNVVFRGPRPVFVDWGSFVPCDGTSPIWRPAGQLQRQALLPALLLRHRHWPVHQLLKSFPDGIDHLQAHRALGWVTMLGDPSVAWHVALPAALARRGSGPSAAPVVETAVAARTVDMTLSGLERAFSRERTRLRPPGSVWAGYEDCRDHYATTELVAKREAVRRLVDRLAPSEVLDIGANGGEFSAIAARTAGVVVAVDSDVDALRRARVVTAQFGAVHHALIDLAGPSPAMGWRGAECDSWDARCEGRFDLVMALAVLHHLTLSGGVPLDEVIAWLATSTRRHALVEFVDPSDPRFAELAAARGRDGSGLQRDDFESVARQHFSIRQRDELVPGKRWLYWLEKV